MQFNFSHNVAIVGSFFKILKVQEVGKYTGKGLLVDSGVDLLFR